MAAGRWPNARPADRWPTDPSGFDTIMPKARATATVDRLLLFLLAPRLTWS